MLPQTRMWIHALALLLTAGCGNQNTSLPETLYLDLHSTNSSDFCSPEQETLSKPHKASLLLFPENTAFYTSFDSAEKILAGKYRRFISASRTYMKQGNFRI